MSPDRTVPLRYLARLDPGKSEVRHLPDDLEVDFIPMEAVGHGGRLHPIETRPLGEVRDGYTYLKSGDVTFAKISPSFQNRKGGRAQGLTNGLAFATTELTILRPEATTDARFLQYAIESEPFIQHGAATLHGVAGQQRVDLSRIAAFPVWSPDLDTQRRIADMLDAETARIDTLIEKNQRVLELLDLRFWSWVEHVAHHGLMPKAAVTSHPVWGEHPSHWIATTLGRAAVSMVDGPFGSSLTSAHYSDVGRRVVRLGNIGRGRFKDEVRAFVPEDHYRALASHEVRGGDLVMGGLGDEASDAPVGRACVVPDEFGSGIVKADCYRIRLVDSVDHEFAAWALSSRSQLAYAASKARGATRPRLNLQLASELPLPVPPLAEQQAIASEVGNRVGQLHELRAKVDRQQELLRLRRQALITAAVTGEIEA